MPVFRKANRVISGEIDFLGNCRRRAEEGAGGARRRFAKNGARKVSVDQREPEDKRRKDGA